MQKTIVQSALFSKILDKLIAERKLSEPDFEAFERLLMQNPKQGDVIPGLSGLRKTRVRSVSKGKSGGFRIDYLDLSERGLIHLIVIYPKSVKEDLSAEEKKIILRMVHQIKEEAKNG